MSVPLQPASTGAAALASQSHQNSGAAAAVYRGRRLEFSLTSCFLLLSFLVSLGSCQGIPVNTWAHNGPGTGLSLGPTEWVSVGAEIANFNQPTVTYNDKSTGMTCWQKFDEDKWTRLGPAGFHKGVSLYVKMVLDSVGRHIVGYRGNSKAITVVSFQPDSNSWAPIGSSRFTGPASFLDMAVDLKTDDVFIVYRDEAVANKASVQRFRGGKWGFVGPRGFTPGAVTDTRIAVGSSGAIGVAAVEPARGGRASMWQLSADKKTWRAIGPLGSTSAGAGSSGKAAGLRLAYTTGGAPDKPHIAYMDITNPAKPVAAVSRWSVSQNKWVRLGTSAGAVAPAARSLAFGVRANVAHVLYADATVGGRATLKKFVAGSWRVVGNAGFSKGMARSLDIAWDKDGVAVVGMADAANKNKTTIMQCPLYTFQGLGDWGRQGQFRQGVVASLMGAVASRKPLNNVITTGDNFYPAGLVSVSDSRFENSFMDVYTQPGLKVKWIGVLGNHDNGHGASDCPDCPNSPLHQLGAKGVRSRDSRWNIQRLGSQKIGDEGQVEVFMYDSSVFISEYQRSSFALAPGGISDVNPGEHLASLERLLKASTAKWKILIGHHPTWTNGDHGNQREIITKIEPLILKYGVQAYFCGHDHNLEHLRKRIGTKTYDIIVTGAGSQVDRNQMSTVDSLFYYERNGFVHATVQPDELMVEFFTLEKGDRPAYIARIPRVAKFT